MESKLPKALAVSTICKKERKRKKPSADNEVVSVDDNSNGVSTKSSDLSLTLQSGMCKGEHAWILCAAARFVKEHTYCLQISFMVRYPTSDPPQSND